MLRFIVTPHALISFAVAIVFGLLIATTTSADDFQGNDSLVSTTTPSKNEMHGIDIIEATRNLTYPTFTFDLTQAPDDLWIRIQRGFGMPNIASPLVTSLEQTYARHPEHFVRLLQQARPFLHYIVDEVEKRGLPTELALLPMVESAFNPQAQSSAKASGLWQFIPSTGRDYALAQNQWIDARMDVVESTRAALDYLQNLYELQGDWPLALASYNWGEGSVLKAIAQNTAAGRPTDYLSLNMPKETRYYVPKLQAIKNIIAHPERFHIVLPKLNNTPVITTLIVNEKLDVSTAASLAGISLEQFNRLNSNFKRPILFGPEQNQSTRIVLPVEQIETFRKNLERFQQENRPLTQWTTLTVNERTHIKELVKRSGVPKNTLLNINGLTQQTQWVTGTLLVPKDAQGFHGLKINPPTLPKLSAQAPHIRTKTSHSVAKKIALPPLSAHKKQSKHSNKSPTQKNSQHKTIPPSPLKK